MNLEQQVISLELAKQLKELGIKPSSLFYWVCHKNNPIAAFSICYIHWFHELDDTDSIDNYEIYSAFTVAELGEMLRDFELSTRYYEIDHYNTYDFYNLVIKAATCSGRESFYAKDESEANARAKILTFILENKLMEVPE